MLHVLVQEGVIEGLHHQIVHQALKSSQIADHAGAWINLTSHSHIHQVVVAMAIGAGTLAIDRLVFRLRKLRARQTVGCSEVGANGDESVHAVSEVISPEALGFMQPQCDQGEVWRQSLPNHPHKSFGGGEAALGLAKIKFWPSLIEEAEVELPRHLRADGMFDIREVEHHAIRIESPSHRHDQLVVVTMAWRDRARTEAGGVVVGT